MFCVRIMSDLLNNLQQVKWGMRVNKKVVNIEDIFIFVQYNGR